MLTGQCDSCISQIDLYLDEGKNSNIPNVPLGMLALWHLFRFTGSDQLQDITQHQINAIFEEMGSVDFVTRDFMLFCSEIAGCSFIIYLRV